MATSKGRLAEGGRLVIPAELRRRLGLEPGDAVVIELRGQELRIRSAAGALRRLQDRLASRVAPDARVSEELLEERRADAADDRAESRSAGARRARPSARRAPG